jgi:hypothetical protein
MCVYVYNVHHTFIKCSHSAASANHGTSTFVMYTRISIHACLVFWAFTAHRDVCMYTRQHHLLRRETCALQLPVVPRLALYRALCQQWSWSRHSAYTHIHIHRRVSTDMLSHANSLKCLHTYIHTYIHTYTYTHTYTHPKSTWAHTHTFLMFNISLYTHTFELV